MMGTAFTGARVRCAEGVPTQETSADITCLIQSLKAFCGDVWSCFNFKNISSLVLHEPWVARAGGFNLASKACINYSKALIRGRVEIIQGFFLNKLINSQAILDLFQS